MMRSGGTRILFGAALALALLGGGGPGLLGPGEALAGTAARRADMTAAGVDMMPVGTARQVERLRRARRPMP